MDDLHLEPNHLRQFYDILISVFGNYRNEALIPRLEYLIYNTARRDI